MQLATVGVYLMLAYPPLILLFDLSLWLSGRPTITRDVKNSPVLKIAVCAYLVAWCVLLTGHFLSFWL